MVGSLSRELSWGRRRLKAAASTKSRGAAVFAAFKKNPIKREGRAAVFK
jgi:hypothetical protein